MSTAKQSRGSSVVELAMIAIIAVALAYAIQAWVIKPYKIPSGSMEPTLLPGQRILVDRIGLDFSSPQIGDIMVFHPPVNTSSCADSSEGAGAGGQDQAEACDTVGAAESTTTFVKRVVGLPGDRLQIINGHVIRNGRPEPDAYAVSCVGNAICNFPGTIVVPKGDYYMMGDNRPDSEDSRFWGPVPRGWLIGYVFFRYWPLGHLGTV